MKLIVDQPQRKAKMRAHTATHLLHAQLEYILKNTKQAGSMVDEDITRFDFQTDRLLTSEELVNIEKNINLIIYQALPVSKREMSYNDAIKLGAKAFFEDKYGDVVRVIIIGDDQTGKEGKSDEQGKKGYGVISIELCGGTHVDNTSEIGCFKIIGQEAVASGVKRLTAVTGPKVYEYLSEQENIFADLAKKLDVKPKQLREKLEKTLKEFQDLNDKYISLSTKMLISEIKSLYEKAKNDKDFDKIISIPKENMLSDFNFKNIVDQTKGLFKDQIILLYNAGGNFAIIGGKGKSAVEISKKIGLKGGGNENLVQGRDEKVLEILK